MKNKKSKLTKVLSQFEADIKQKKEAEKKNEIKNLHRDIDRVINSKKPVKKIRIDEDKDFDFIGSMKRINELQANPDILYTVGEYALYIWQAMAVMANPSPSVKDYGATIMSTLVLLEKKGMIKINMNYKK